MIPAGSTVATARGLPLPTDPHCPPLCLPAKAPPLKKMTFYYLNQNTPSPASPPPKPFSAHRTRTAQARSWHTGAAKALMHHCATLICARAPRAVLFRVGVKTRTAKQAFPSRFAPRAPRPVRRRCAHANTTHVCTQRVNTIRAQCTHLFDTRRNSLA